MTGRAQITTPVDLPPQGAPVRVHLDGKGCVRSGEVLNQVTGAHPFRNGFAELNEEVRM